MVKKFIDWVLRKLEKRANEPVRPPEVRIPPAPPIPHELDPDEDTPVDSLTGKRRRWH